MAQTGDRFEKGVGQGPKGIGEYFVAEHCIDCDLCRQMAPQIFKRKFTGAGGMSYVERQPTSELELRQTTDALDACPVGAIQKQLAESTVMA
jgi:ferredoxin